MEVRDGELMMFNEWDYEWEEKSEGRRQKGGVSYSPPERTSHVLTPTRLSRSLLRPSTLSIGSGTCEPTGNCGGIRSSRSRILLCLLLDRAAELVSSGHGLCFPCTALEEKRGTYDGSFTFWGGEIGT